MPCQQLQPPPQYSWAYTYKFIIRTEEVVGGKIPVFDLIICDFNQVLFSLNTELFELVSMLRTGKCYSPILSCGTLCNSSFKRTICHFFKISFLMQVTHWGNVKPKVCLLYLMQHYNMFDSANLHSSLFPWSSDGGLFKNYLKKIVDLRMAWSAQTSQISS